MAQLAEISGTVSMEEAKRRLMEAIDGHLEARERSLAAQLQQNDTI